MQELESLAAIGDLDAVKSLVEQSASLDAKDWVRINTYKITHL